MPYSKMLAMQIYLGYFGFVFIILIAFFFLFLNNDYQFKKKASVVINPPIFSP